MKATILASAFVAACLAAASTAQAALIAYEPFNYTGGTALLGQDGGTGWTGAWCNSLTPGNASQTITSPGLDHSGLAESGLKATLVGNSGGTGATSLFRQLKFPSGFSTDTLYFSFLAKANNDAERPWGMSLANVSASSNPLDNLVGGDSGSAYFSLQESSNYNISYHGSLVSTSTLSLLVAKFDLSTGNATLYVFPTGTAIPSNESSASAYATSNIATPGNSMGTINGIRLYALGKSASGTYSAKSADFDELRVGTTYADVIGVPEPSALLLLAVGSGLLAAHAWRKRIGY